MRLILIILLLSTTFLHAQTPVEPPVYEVIDNSYQVCDSEAGYRQLLSFSLYGVGTPPDDGCFYAAGGTKVVILQCPESDIILCQFRLEPDGSDPVTVWASKVMLRERE